MRVFSSVPTVGAELRELSRQRSLRATRKQMVNEVYCLHFDSFMRAIAPVHKDPLVTMSYSHSLDAVLTCVTCPQCDTRWNHPTSWHAFVLNPRGWLRYEVIPFIASVAEAECWGPRERSYAAEWLTERLILAGPGGMSTQGLVYEAVAGHELGSADAIHALLHRMEFKSWNPDGLSWVELPTGHPLRRW